MQHAQGEQYPLLQNVIFSDYCADAISTDYSSSSRNLSYGRVRPLPDRSAITYVRGYIWVNLTSTACLGGQHQR
jgi:hypothetical protein